MKTVLRATTVWQKSVFGIFITFAVAMHTAAILPAPEFGPPTLVNNDGLTDGDPISLLFESDDRPAVATDGQGNWVTVWRKRDHWSSGMGNYPDYDILSAHSSDNGHTWSDPVKVIPIPSSDFVWEDHPSIATDGKGVWIVVWDSNQYEQSSFSEDVASKYRPTGDSEVMFAKSTDFGATWSTASTIITNAGTDDQDDIEPSIRTNRRGVWEVAWIEAGSLDNTFAVCARSTDGNTWSEPVTLGEMRGQDYGISGRAQGVWLETDEQGNWIAAWHHTEMRAVRSNDNGQTWSTPVEIPLRQRTGLSYGGNLATDKAGHWVLVWEGEVSWSNESFFVSRSEDNGATWSDPEAIAGSTGENLRAKTPVVATDGWGNWCLFSGAEQATLSGLRRVQSISYSTDNGATWTEPGQLHPDLGLINIGGITSYSPGIATDRVGNWVFVTATNITFDTPDGSENDIIAYIAEASLSPSGWPDSDGDNFSDYFELLIIDHDPFDTISGFEEVSPDDDFDGDGMTNLQEFTYRTSPTSPDAPLPASRALYLLLTAFPVAVLGVYILRSSRRPRISL